MHMHTHVLMGAHAHTHAYTDSLAHSHERSRSRSRILTKVQLWADLRQWHAMAATPGTLASIAAASPSDAKIIADSPDVFDLDLLLRAVRA
jgi:hypothetical protein